MTTPTLPDIPAPIDGMLEPGDYTRDDMREHREDYARPAVEALRELLEAALAIYPPFEGGVEAQGAWANRKKAAEDLALAVLAIYEKKA